MSGRQLPLFGEAESAATATGTSKTAPIAIEPRVTGDDVALAARLPAWLHFGTSSWSFPGWENIVWRGHHEGDELARSGLRAYAQHPLLRTVSIDRSYYGPLRAHEIDAYAKQLDEAAALTPALPPFRVVSKVWEEITTAVFPRHPRYGARAGEKNPTFLDPSRFLDEVLAPYVPHARHFGPFVFELTPMPKGTFDDATLARRVASFLSALPESFSWACELRNEELLTARWFDVLRAHRTAHVFTYWTAMPSLRVQLARHGPLTGSPFVIARLMLPPFTRYADKKAEYAPFDRLVTPQPEMQDDVLLLLRAALEANAKAVFVLANNKAEGSAPLTVKSLAARVVRELPLANAPTW
jgi:uncharacterized protein YecE (DUF72 family)